MVLVRKVKTESSEQVPFKISFYLTKADVARALHQAPSSPFSKFTTGKDSALICE